MSRTESRQAIHNAHPPAESTMLYESERVLYVLSKCVG